MESTEERYGWAPDDPRWTDQIAGGNGRTEPSPTPGPRDGADAVEPSVAPEAAQPDGWRVVTAAPTEPGSAAPDGWQVPAPLAPRPAESEWHTALRQTEPGVSTPSTSAPEVPRPAAQPTWSAAGPEAAAPTV